MGRRERGGQVLLLGWTETSGPGGAREWWYLPVEVADHREALRRVGLLKRTPAKLEQQFGRGKCRGPDLRAAVDCLLREG